MGEHPSVMHFRAWLAAGCAGCKFAAFFARRGHLRAATIPGVPKTTDLVRIADFIDAESNDRRTALLLFPHLRCTQAIRELIEVLVKSPRWTVHSVPWGEHARYDDELIGLTWSTSAGLISQAMGFAPIGSMPATRRAPYAAIALWAGGHENQHRSKPKDPRIVTFVDTANEFTFEEHEQRWTKSSELTSAYLQDPPEDIKLFRRVAFCLPRS